MENNQKGSKIKRRVVVLNTMIVSFFLLTVVMIAMSIATFKAIRTFVYGESLWTRSQIAANYSLTLYLTTRNEQYYKNFLSALKLIESNEAGLNEIIEKKRVTTRSIDLIQADVNDRLDVIVALHLFAYLADLSVTKTMIVEWQNGNRLIHELRGIGSKIHQDYVNQIKYPPTKIQQIQQQIHQNNIELNKHEIRYSLPLIQAAREVEQLLGMIHLYLFLMVVFLAAYIYSSTKQIFQRSLTTIKKSIQDAVTGNVNQQILIPFEEDIYGISVHLNLMYQSFQEQLKGRLSAQESEARLALLADAMPQIVCIYDKNYEMEFLNRNGRVYTGIDADRLKGENLIDFCHPNEKSKALQQRKHGTLNKCPTEFEVRLRNTQGHYQWFLCRFEPLLEEDEIVRWFATFTNIQTQKVHALELEKSVAIRDQFLSIASHELKTPLTVLKLQTGMRQRLLDKKILKAIELDYFQKNITDDKKQIDRLIRLVDDMLDISRIKSGKLSFNSSEIEVNEFMIEVLQRFYPEFSERKCELIFDPIPMTFCHWDGQRIEQVMINLLSNALKYGRNKDVTVKLHKQDESIQIHVKDQGEGIPPENKEKIFELFERANHDRAVSGLGLGLFIVRQIVQSHHGKIEVISEPNLGSTFIITLPTKIL